jgi:hypothetical protein
MNTSKAKTKSDSQQMAIMAVLEMQRNLIREMRDLLTSYAPPWYTEEMDTRVSKALAIPTAPRSQTRH